MTTIAILSAISVLIICTSLYFTNKKMDKMTNVMKKLYSNVQFLDILINYVIADDIYEIREQLEDYEFKLKSKSKLNSYTEKDANDPKNQA